MKNAATISGTEIAFVTQTDDRHLSLTQQIIITICYLIGIFGNLLAMILLYKKSLPLNNVKYNLILKCLSANDLVALLGMLILMYTQLYATGKDNIWVCRGRVVWRVFGIGSGCVAIVMAVERWLAVTKPFVYQKNITTELLRRCIFTSWSFALVLVSMPLFGFGLYYEPNNKDRKCVSYKEAKTMIDVTYAYVYFTIGMCLCLGIVCCNIAVMRTLCNKCYTYENKCNTVNIQKPVLMRRITGNISEMSTSSTREEIAFGRLMGFLCVTFVACWMPQLLTIPLHQMRPNSKSYHYYRIPDMLMALHFVLDPYIYVLQSSSTFRKLFCYNRTQYPQYRPSIRMHRSISP